MKLIITTEQPEERLDSLNSDEFFDVIQILKPNITREEYDRIWDEFQEAKREGRLKPSN